MSTDRAKSVRGKKAYVNPFLNFLREFRLKYKGYPATITSSKAGHAWRHMNKQEKHPYVSLAKQAKELKGIKRGYRSKNKRIRKRARSRSVARRSISMTRAKSVSRRSKSTVRRSKSVTRKQKPAKRGRTPKREDNYPDNDNDQDMPLEGNENNSNSPNEEEQDKDKPSEGGRSFFKSMFSRNVSRSSLR